MDDFNKLLGVLVPFLLGNGMNGMMQKMMGPSNLGATSNDAIESLRSGIYNAGMNLMGTMPPQNIITAGADRMVGALGVNPYGGFGQAASNVLSTLYQVAPGAMGRLMGIPDSRDFIGTIMNGSPAINAAAGFGGASVFSPSSMMESMQNAHDAAMMMYGFGVSNSGGIKTEYTHGLSGREQGLVAQRLLSSNMAYARDNESNVDRFDLSLDEDADAFGEKLKQLGEKFNGVMSTLSKVTGSVEESLKFMDSIAGGNFAGGTTRQAVEIANRAENIATAIRTTSAFAGVSPTRAFQNIMSQSSAVARRMNLDYGLAQNSGFGGVFNEMATQGELAFNIWQGENSGATTQQQAAARQSINAAVQNFAGSSTMKMAVAAASNWDMYSDEERERITNAIAAGRPNDVVDLIMSKGTSHFSEIMNSPAAYTAYLKDVSQRNDASSKWLKEMYAAGVQGTFKEASSEGASMILEGRISDVMDMLSAGAGDSGSEYDAMNDRQNNAKLEALKSVAKTLGIKSDDWSVDNLDDYQRLVEEEAAASGMSAETVRRNVNSAAISQIENDIDARTMSSEEEGQAKQRLIDRINASDISEDSKKELIGRLGKDGWQKNLGGIVSSFTRKLGITDRDDADKLKNDILGGKITMDEANGMKATLADQKKIWATEFTDEEKSKATEMTRKTLEQRAQQEEYATAVKSSTKDYLDHIEGLVESGAADVIGSEEEDDPSIALENAKEASTREIVKKILGKSFPSIGGDNAASAEDEIVAGIMQSINDGSDKSFEDALTENLAAFGDKFRGKEGGDKIADTIRHILDSGVTEGKNVAFNTGVSSRIRVTGPEFDENNAEHVAMRNRSLEALRFNGTSAAYGASTAEGAAINGAVTGEVIDATGKAFDLNNQVNDGNSPLSRSREALSIADSYLAHEDKMWGEIGYEQDIDKAKKNVYRLSKAWKKSGLSDKDFKDIVAKGSSHEKFKKLQKAFGDTDMSDADIMNVMSGISNTGGVDLLKKDKKSLFDLDKSNFEGVAKNFGKSGSVAYDVGNALSVIIKLLSGITENTTSLRT